MIRISACIEMLFEEHDFYDRPAAAKAAGLDAFEFWRWRNTDLDRLAPIATGVLPLAACCVDTRDVARQNAIQNLGLLDAANANVLCENVEETCQALLPLGVRTFLVTTGNELSTPRHQQHDAVIACLSAAAPIAEKYGVTLALEPLNILRDHKGYYLATSAEAADILRAVNSANVKMLFDVYHQQITEGNLIPNLTAYAPLLGHVHVADNPGRNQPGTGEINYRNVLAAIDKNGYTGYIGLEYAPKGVSSALSLAGIRQAAADAAV